MKRTTIMLPDDLKMRALKRAEITGLSLGGFIRESLEKTLQPPDVDQVDEDPFFADNFVYQGKTPKDLALNYDDYLYGNLN
jgi:hypothetical protein